jgi:hypothetical protein
MTPGRKGSMRTSAPLPVAGEGCQCRHLQSLRSTPTPSGRFRSSAMLRLPRAVTS